MNASKWLSVFLLACAAVGTTGCETVSGVGQDIEHLGAEIDEAAREERDD